MLTYMEMNLDFFSTVFGFVFKHVWTAFILLDMQEFFSEMIYSQDKN